MLGSRLSPPRKRSESETATDCRSKVVVAVCSDSASAALAVAACLASVVAERAVAYSGFVLVAVAPAVHGCFDSGVAAFLGEEYVLSPPSWFLS